MITNFSEVEEDLVKIITHTDTNSGFNKQGGVAKVGESVKK